MGGGRWVAVAAVDGDGSGGGRFVAQPPVQHYHDRRHVSEAGGRLVGEDGGWWEVVGGGREGSGGG